tara:strand:- start:682 stop:858 length:177 start_codon:yes stop_codon:yes gene_type:complete
MKIKTINITDKISRRDAEYVSEIVADALTDMGIKLGDDPSFSWNIEVDYEELERKNNG